MSKFERNPLLEAAGLYDSGAEDVEIDIDICDFVELYCDDPLCKGRLKMGPIAYAPRSGRLYHVGHCMLAENMEGDHRPEFTFVSYEEGVMLHDGLIERLDS